MYIPKSYVKKLRSGIQLAFLIFTLFIGYRFYRFVIHFENPEIPFVPRPPSVDAFLPISGLMSLKYFLFTGIVEPVHPAALTIFVAVIAVSIASKKGFCGWICPVGTISEYLWKSGRKLTGKDPRMEKHADIVLMSLKYLLLALFILLIGIAITPNMMVLFFMADYYKVVDVRMLKFFADMSRVTLIVLIALAVLSFVFKNFWCRYLCPYGALLGLVSKLSPLKVKRNEEKCLHCHRCTENCPALIPVENKETVSSAECIGCLTCVGNCPSEGALDVVARPSRGFRTVKPWIFALIMLLVFYSIIGIGMITGNWKSGMPYEEYERIIPKLSELTSEIVPPEKSTPLPE